MPPKKPPAQPNQSLQDGIECLEALVGAGRPVGSRELSRMLGMEPTRANRLLGTLAYIGLAQQTPNRKYEPGPGIHLLAAMSLRGSNLLAVALPIIQELQQQTNAIVALGVLWRDKVCYLYHGKSSEAAAGIGGQDLYPVDRSSIGLILLAERDEEGVREVLSYRSRDDSLVDEDKVFRCVNKARKQGWAMLSEARSIAVPVGSPAAAALAIAGSGEPDELKSWLPNLRDAAKRIAEATGNT